MLIIGFYAKMYMNQTDCLLKLNIFDYLYNLVLHFYENTYAHKLTVDYKVNFVLYGAFKPSAVRTLKTAP